MSIGETMANIAVGLVVSLALTFWVLPWWGYVPTVGQAIEITLVFTGASIVRMYAMRRAFEVMRLRRWS